MLITVTPGLHTEALGVEAQASTMVSKEGKQGVILKETLSLRCWACTCMDLRGTTSLYVTF